VPVLCRPAQVLLQGAEDGVRLRQPLRGEQQHADLAPQFERFAAAGGALPSDVVEKRLEAGERGFGVS
jgi:hypothetical protein